jgi:hypothetical protein
MSRLATATITFGSHSVRIRVNEEGTISVFKHMDRWCEYELFTDQDEAADYIIKPFTTMHYRIVWTEDGSDAV